MSKLSREEVETCIQVWSGGGGNTAEHPPTALDFARALLKAWDALGEAQIMCRRLTKEKQEWISFYESAKARAEQAEAKLAGVLGGATIARDPKEGDHTEAAYSAHKERYMQGGAYAEGADIVAEIDLRRRDAEKERDEAMAIIQSFSDQSKSGRYPEVKTKPEECEVCGKRSGAHGPSCRRRHTGLRFPEET